VLDLLVGEIEEDRSGDEVGLLLAGEQRDQRHLVHGQRALARSILSAARFPMLAASGVEIDPEDESGFAIGPFKVGLLLAGEQRDQRHLVHGQRALAHEGPLAAAGRGRLLPELKEADLVTRPIFLDLAYKQIEHWISSSDQRSILSDVVPAALSVGTVEHLEGADREA
jgi:hypothetical protein